jgi:hypothetical protein
MMNTAKPKYEVRYTLHYWNEGDNAPDNMIHDNLTEAMQTLRLLWPDATTHTTPDGIEARIVGERVAIVTLTGQVPEGVYCIPSRS